MKAWWPKPESITYINGDFLLEIMGRKKKKPSEANSELRNRKWGFLSTSQKQGLQRCLRVNN